MQILQVKELSLSAKPNLHAGESFGKSPDLIISIPEELSGRNIEYVWVPKPSEPAPQAPLRYHEDDVEVHNEWLTVLLETI